MLAASVTASTLGAILPYVCVRKRAATQDDV
jgi:hypothetical protein